jgi:hypothetical protein
MLERDLKPNDEGSGVMLFQLLKSLLMILPQSTCYRILRDRLVSVSRFRQSTMIVKSSKSARDAKLKNLTADTKSYIARVQYVRRQNCSATWQKIRQESLEVPKRIIELVVDEGADRRKWLGYASKEEQEESAKQHQRDKYERQSNGFSVEEVTNNYQDLETITDDSTKLKSLVANDTSNVQSETMTRDTNVEEPWKQFWSTGISDPLN